MEIIRSDTEGESEALYMLEEYKLNNLIIDQKLNLLTEDTYKWYLIVFKPLNSNYNEAFNALDYIRKEFTKFAVSYLITKETKASKVHWNLLICSKEDLNIMYHNKRTKRFMIYCEITHDQYRCFAYITKEFYEDKLKWKKYIDFNLI